MSVKLAKKANPTKLRPSITPGTVLILLAGRFRGKRVVFLKQLESGLLLVSGPFKINGVPLRRVNQSYVIATSTKVDISGVSIPAEVNDAFFAKEKSANKGEATFFKEGEASELPASKKDAQKAVDAGLVKAVKATPHLDKYLGHLFGLSKGQYPHLLKF